MSKKIKTFTRQKSRISDHAQKLRFLTPKSIADWRDWLEKNHLKESRIILVKYKKHTGKPVLNPHLLMREAICFGWIDTTAKRVDEDRYSITYVRRNKNSKWSENTLRYGKELITEGKMSPFGLKMYMEGLGKKTHDHGIPKNPKMPKDLKGALEKDADVKRFFDTLPPSIKRMYYRWILHAKLEDTRKRRIEKIVQTCKSKIKNLFLSA